MAIYSKSKTFPKENTIWLGRILTRCLGLHPAYCFVQIKARRSHLSCGQYPQKKDPSFKSQNCREQNISTVSERLAAPPASHKPGITSIQRMGKMGCHLSIFTACHSLSSPPLYVFWLSTLGALMLLWYSWKQDMS